MIGMDEKTPLISENLLKLLVCPVSGGILSLVSNSKKNDDGENIALYCHQSSLVYPIKNGIPVLVPELARQEFRK
jgi:uncharacterized protein YbaR (Trm112 family)